MNVYLLTLYKRPYSIFSSNRKATAAAKALAKAAGRAGIDNVPTEIIKVSVDIENYMMEHIHE